MSNFLGRDYELDLLKNLLSKKTASLVVIRGRRRIGKSRLAEEFAAHYQFYSFAGVAPHDKTTDTTEKDVFLNQLKQYFKNVKIDNNDWFDLLWFLAKKTHKGRVVILFDEISWMGTQDPDFIGKLKTVWDTHFKKNNKLILILCGSVSMWIKKHILLNTGFVGRISLQLTLKELPLSICNQFFYERSKQLSAFEKFQFLAICGGVPKYLEEWQSNLSVDNNINKMCFHSSGLLFNEFNQIFYDSLSSHATIYKLIVSTLIVSPTERTDIIRKLKRMKGGDISDYLDNLVSAGFITRDYTWNIKNKKLSKLSRFRLSDNYLRFYLKYIEPHAAAIQTRQYKVDSLSHFSGWASIIGLQFEHLVLTNRDAIQKMLGIHRDNIEIDNPFFQTKTRQSDGCQIDYLIQTKTNTLYACEIKFSRNEIKMDVVREMEKKLSALSIPRGFSCLPVLIQVNGVHDSVLDSNYFFKVINFSDLL